MAWLTAARLAVRHATRVRDEPTPDPPIVGLRVSSSCSDGNCVAVGWSGEDVVVLDTKDASSRMLRFTHEEWAAFISGVKNGEFDPT